MGDSCLNSVHLEPPRRLRFRHARQALLDACGDHTIAFQRHGPVDKSANSPFASQAGSNIRSSVNGRYWLSDGRQAFPLQVGVNMIGRAPDCDIIVEDGCISRRHCVVLVHAGNHCEVHDVASKNGTYLNGAKLSRPSSLKSGDEILLSGSHFFLIDKNEPQALSSHTFLDPVA
ncbi:MAG: FHA domain-containing protein [Gemmataceae bacterium]